MQPWPWLIIRPDIQDPEQRLHALDAGLMKAVENRTWPTKFRGSFLIHAGQKFDRDGYDWVRESFPNIQMPPPPSQGPGFDLGGIVGKVDLIDCVTPASNAGARLLGLSFSRWYFGSCGFVLANSRPMPFVPLKGKLQFFEVSDDCLR